MRSIRTRPVLGLALATAAVLTMVSCSSDDDASRSASTDGVEQTTDTATTGGQEFLQQALDRGVPEIGEYDATDELVVTDDVEGTGTEVQPHAIVTVHYLGAQLGTGEVFDSSWSRNDTISFPLDGVIQGWSEGLVGMKEGGRRTLVIPSDLAYGSTPPPGSGIAPDADLVFVVDMIEVQNP